MKLHACLQERPRSPGVHVLQTGRQAEPSADHGTGTPHPQGSHIQGEQVCELGPSWVSLDLSQGQNTHIL